MANLLTMPSLSPTMESGVIGAWKAKVGDHVEPGQVLAEIETDKAVMDFEAVDEGYLREFLVEPGQEVPVGTPIAVLTETADEDYADALKQAKGAASAEKPQAPREEAQAPAEQPEAPAAAPGGNGEAAPAAAAGPATPAAEIPPPPATTEPKEPPAPAARRPTNGAGRTRISPYARKLAEAEELDWHSLEGSGPGGRIVARDVEAALEAGPAARAPAQAPLAPAAGEPHQDLPLSMMRKAIAKKMAEAKRSVPHFQVTRKVRMEALLQAREGLKAQFPDQPVSLNDMLVKACAVALRHHPAVNSQFQDDRIRQFNTVDIAVAVGTDEGLVTPVVRDVDRKGLARIAAEMRALAERARERKLAPEEYQGGTFTVSNLGMFGVHEFNAIINTPQACILAVSAVIREPVVEGDALAIGHTMNVTLSADHRVVDGIAAARFLETLDRILTNPVALTL